MSELRLACWSGPRNISTAMMRAWENRPDCTVVDEPLYACYLRRTGLDHPGRDDVLAAQSDDWRRVLDELTGPIPGGRSIWYQKHMAHHWLADMDPAALNGLSHAFLIRDPREVLLSYTRTRTPLSADEIGVPQQRWLFDKVAEDSGAAPVVIDAADFLAAPDAYLRAWCAHLGIGFTEAMLRWPAGSRASDGVWAPHWYAAVNASTGFAPYQPRQGRLSPDLAALADACAADYEYLRRYRLVV